MLRHRAGDARRVRRRAGGDGLSVSRSSRRASFRSGQRSTVSVNVEAAQGTSYYEMVEVDQEQVGDDRRQGPRRRDSFICERRRRRRRVRRRRATAGSWCSSSRARQRELPSAADRRSSCGRKCLRHSRASACSSACRRRSGSAAAWRRAELRLTMQGPNTERALRVGAAARAGDRARCRKCRTSRATCR